MNILTGVGILLLSMLIMAFLQLKPGVFLLFSHYTSGKFSKNKASTLAFYYILGVEIGIALIFATIYYILNSLFLIVSPSNLILHEWIMAGILFIIGIIFPFCYFKKGSGTKLFISRKLAEKFDLKAKGVKSHSDAFILGIISNLPELFFVIPLFIISITYVMQLNIIGALRGTIILILILINVIPLFVVHILFHRGYNLADLEKKREKSKNFIRFFVGLSYLLIAILIVSLKVIL